MSENGSCLWLEQRDTPTHWPAAPRPRGWIAEANRHRRLLARLDTLIAQAQAG